MPIIKRECVDNKKWMTKKEFDKVVIITNMLPGASVIQTTSYIACYCLGKVKGIIVTLIAMIPHILFAFGLFKLFSYIPTEWIHYIAIGTLISIIVFLFAFGYRYLKEANKKMSLPLWIIIFSFSLVYTVFVPNPYNIPIVPIIVVFLVYIIYYFIKNRKINKGDSNDSTLG